MLKKFFSISVFSVFLLGVAIIPTQAQQPNGYFMIRGDRLRSISDIIQDRLWQRFFTDSNYCEEPQTNPDPVCGNQLVEIGEQCDGSAPNGFSCNNQCLLVADPPPAPVCGNGKIEDGELCDGYAPPGYTCSSQCIFVPDEPVAYCGDGVVNQASEQCDGQAGVGTGQICTSQCTLVDSSSGTGGGQVVINEVYSNTDSEHGSEGVNEWVELYNPTSNSVTLSDWILGGEILPAVSIPSGGFAIVTPNTGTSTLDFWSFPQGTVIVEIEGLITSGGLANGGDALELRNQSDELIDALSYGSNDTILNPSPSAPGEGKSLSRQPNGIDTDTDSDWVVLDEPTPGS